jgi:hypothetical protein
MFSVAREKALRDTVWSFPSEGDVRYVEAFSYPEVPYPHGN